MTKLDKEQVIANFIAAYKAAFGKEPQLEQKPGWFSVDGGKNIRLAELEELGNSYSKTAKPAAKASKAPAAEPATAKTAPKKPAAPKTKTSSGNGSKAAALWASNLNSAQRLPRGSR